jgi:hypothetical protein
MLTITGTAVSISLPDPIDWDVRRERPQEAARTLDGGSVISTWPKSDEGATAEYKQIITEAQYQALRVADEHATITSWTVGTPSGAIYTATIDVTSAVRTMKNRAPAREVTMKITMIAKVFE